MNPSSGPYAAAVIAMTVAGAAAAAPPVVPRSLGRIPPEVAALTLPTGKLVPLSGSPRQMTFEDVERSSFSRAGGIVVTYDVPYPPYPTDLGPSAQMVRRWRVDCAHRMVQELGSMAYDQNGGIVMWLPPQTPVSASGNGLAAGHVKLVCEGAWPPSPAVLGHKAAFTFANRWLASQAAKRD